MKASPAEPPAGLARALALIAVEAAAGVNDLGRMVAVDTSFPPGAGYRVFADLMEELVRPLGFRCCRVNVPERLWRTAGGVVHGERVNLIAERRTGKLVCGLYFHVDTVPAVGGWTQIGRASCRERV